MGTQAREGDREGAGGANSLRPVNSPLPRGLGSSLHPLEVDRGLEGEAELRKSEITITSPFLPPSLLPPWFFFLIFLPPPFLSLSFIYILNKYLMAIVYFVVWRLAITPKINVLQMSG